MPFPQAAYRPRDVAKQCEPARTSDQPELQFRGGFRTFVQVSALGCIDLGDRRSEVQILSARQQKLLVRCGPWADRLGGRVVGVLADSLTRTVSRTETRKALLDGDTVLATPYGPEAPFSVGTAMGRNKVIYALSTLTVVVASDHETGGTWAGAAEALRGGFGRVAVWRGAGEGPGNAHLVRRGATPLENIDQLEAILAEPDEPVAAPPEASQETLFTG